MWWAVFASGATELVLYRDRDHRVAVAARMSTSTDVDLAAVSFRSIGEWAREVGPQAEGGSALGCADDPVPVNTQVERVATARARFVALDFEAVEDRLHRFMRDLPCGEASLPRSTISGAFLVRGLLAYTRGEADAATADLRIARNVHPDLSFDPSLAASARGLFDSVSPPQPSLWVRISPTPTRVQVDGEVVTYQASRGIHVSPGQHLITVEGGATASVWVDLQADGTVYVPAALGDAMFSAFGDKSRAPELLGLFARFGLEQAWFTDLDTIWRLDGGAFQAVYGVASAPGGKKPKKARKGKERG